MSAADADGWLRQVETYLGLGAGGVVVLIDDADDARLGQLARHLLRKHPDTAIVAAASELGGVPPDSRVLLYLRDGELEPLNLARQVLKDRALRVALWSPRRLTEQLSIRAPDFFDWISHRVECPPGGVPRFVRLGLQAADRAERPIVWQGDLDALRRGVAEAWPGMSLHRMRVERHTDYDDIVEKLERTRDDYVVLQAHPYDLIGPRVAQRSPIGDGKTRLRWALAEAGRRSRVAIHAGGMPVKLEGAWSLDAGTFSISHIENQSARRLLCVMDLEESAGSLAMVRDWVPGVEHDEELLRACLESEDPAVLLGAERTVATRTDLALGYLPWGSSGWELRAWGTDPKVARSLREALREDPSAAAWRALAIIERERLLDDPPADPIPPDVWVECQLWRTGDKPWADMAGVAARAGLHDVAVRWERLAKSGSALLARRVEASLVGGSFEQRRRTMQRVAEGGDETSQPDWWRSLDAHVSCEAGHVSVVADWISSLGESYEPAFAALAHVVVGDWKAARASLVAAAARSVAYGPLAKSALGFAAWSCDEGELVRDLLAADGEQLVRWTPETYFLRWLPVLGLGSPSEAGVNDATEGGSRWWSEPRGGSLDPATGALAAALLDAGAGDHVGAVWHAAAGVAALERVVSPREHYLEGVLILVQARSLARLAQHHRARDLLRLASSIVRRTTSSPTHPWALLADFERAWLDAVHAGGSVKEAERAMEALRAELWSEHVEVQAAVELCAQL